MKIKKWFDSKRFRYGTIANEILPRFHDHFMSTNKEFLELEFDSKELFLHELETQDGVPVIFFKGFSNIYSYGKKLGKHKADLKFEVNGMKAGRVIKLSNQGYLGNHQSIYEIILVTDRFVYMKEVKGKYMSIKSHRELNEMEKFGCLK